jgi:hypothetical protein
MAGMTRMGRAYVVSLALINHDLERHRYRTTRAKDWGSPYDMSSTQLVRQTGLGAIEAIDLLKHRTRSRTR